MNIKTKYKVNVTLLKTLYEERRMSTYRISKELKIPVATVFRYLKRNGIKLRPRLEANKGRVFSEEGKRRISEAKKGIDCLKNYPEIRKRLTAKLKITRLGKNNPHWKGDNVSYTGLHDYVKWHKKKPECCEKCNKKKRLDLANLSGKYRRDLSDWSWLCRSCHMRYDYKKGFRKWSRTK